MRIIVTATLALLLSQWAFGGTVVLRRSWVQKFKDRATIDAKFVIDKSHEHANAAKEDGDLHFAGRAKEIGLPTVAEMVNAAQPSQKAALDFIKANAETGTAVDVSGVWRFWFEHPAASQIQFTKFDPATNTNPAHSFEVHPVTHVGGIDIVKSFDFVKNFPAHDPAKAFGAYEKLKVKIRATATAITMESPKSVFNYTHFRMRLVGKPKKLEDGGMSVIADVERDDGTASDGEDSLASGIRMIFAPGTAGAAMIVGKKDGDEFDALGIPRVNLSAVFKIVEKSGTEQVEGKLPYEIIVVAIKPAD